MSKKIIFTKTLDGVSDDYGPVASSKVLPEWYKNTPSYVNHNIKSLTFEQHISNTNATIKRCIPVFDSLTSGYIIPTPCDLYIRQMPNGDVEYHSAIDNMISYHSVLQAPLHPDNKKNRNYPKWTSAWGIKTEPGYSCLMMAPVHSINPYFTIFTGIVDTDQYVLPINFPFVLNDPNFEGLIPAGTPMVQIIPFKRDSWKMEIGTKKDYDLISKTTAKLISVFYDRYKTFFWSKKEYK